MFRKINNKLLLAIFTTLTILAVIVYIYDQKKGERTFKSELCSVDSAAVTSITIYPKGKGTDFLKLSKEGKGWVVLSQKKRYPDRRASCRERVSSPV